MWCYLSLYPPIRYVITVTDGFSQMGSCIFSLVCDRLSSWGAQFFSSVFGAQRGYINTLPPARLGCPLLNLGMPGISGWIFCCVKILLHTTPSCFCYTFLLLCHLQLLPQMASPAGCCRLLPDALLSVPKSSWCRPVLQYMWQDVMNASFSFWLPGVTRYCNTGAGLTTALEHRGIPR